MFPSDRVPVCRTDTDASHSHCPVSLNYLYPSNFLGMAGSLSDFQRMAKINKEIITCLSISSFNVIGSTVAKPKGDNSNKIQSISAVYTSNYQRQNVSPTSDICCV